MARLKKDMVSGLKLRASSLVEVTTALVIISMIFGLAFMIFLNVQRSGFSRGKLSNSVILDEAYNQIMRSKEFEDKEFQYDNVMLIQQVKRHPQYEHLLMLHFEVRNEEGKLLGERKYLLYDPV